MLFLAVVLLGSRPYILAMAPILLNELSHIIHFIYNTIFSKKPELMDRIGAVVGRSIMIMSIYNCSHC
jgi:hypothetical protein